MAAAGADAPRPERDLDGQCRGFVSFACHLDPRFRRVLRAFYATIDVVATSTARMVKRGMRELSVENGRELRVRGKALRRELATWLMANPPAEPDRPAALSRIESKHGTLSGAQAWVANAAIGLDPKVLSALASDRDSPFFDSQFGIVLRAREQAIDPSRWFERTEPVIVRYGRVRIGLVDWTTDRDAFIEALLGRPVPASPRYEHRGPILPVMFTSDFDAVRQLVGARMEDEVALLDLAGARAEHQLDPLAKLAAATSGGDPVRAAVQYALLRIDPEGFAASPTGRAILKTTRRQPRGRPPRLDLQLDAVFDIGIAGQLGLVFWSGAKQLRSYRAAMAAHLRYLFDYEVAPHNRWPDERTQREALAIWFLDRWAEFAERGQSITRPKITQALRREHPAEYEGEDEAVTVRRLYRISAMLKPDDGDGAIRTHGSLSISGFQV